MDDQTKPSVSEPLSELETALDKLPKTPDGGKAADFISHLESICLDQKNSVTHAALALSIDSALERTAKDHDVTGDGLPALGKLLVEHGVLAIKMGGPTPAIEVPAKWREVIIRNNLPGDKANSPAEPAARPIKNNGPGKNTALTVLSQNLAIVEAYEEALAKYATMWNPGNIAIALAARNLGIADKSLKAILEKLQVVPKTEAPTRRHVGQREYGFARKNKIRTGVPKVFFPAASAAVESDQITAAGKRIAAEFRAGQALTLPEAKISDDARQRYEMTIFTVLYAAKIFLKRQDAMEKALACATELVKAALSSNIERSEINGTLIGHGWMSEDGRPQFDPATGQWFSAPTA